MATISADAVSKQAWTAVQSAAEWGDRTSPDGYEEYLFFKPDELHQILVSFYETIDESRPAPIEITEDMVERLKAILNNPSSSASHDLQAIRQAISRAALQGETK